jgi:hypothetical protein
MPDKRLLSPRLRVFLYGFAALVVVFWLSLEFFGAAGFVAFLAGMGVAQLSFRWRPSLNVAFVTGMLAFAATLAIWTAAFGIPRPSNLHATQTADAVTDSSGNVD